MRLPSRPLLPAFLVALAACSAAPVARLDPADCRLSATSASPQCHALIAPASHIAPDDTSVSLYVEVFPGRGEAAEEEPIVFLTGGPGASLAGYDELGVRRAMVDNIDRPLVFVEQRGNALSSPSLCPSIRGFTPNAAEMERCATELAAAGVDPSEFNGYEASADLADLIEALGHERAVIWGHSYGTVLAQQFAHFFPEHVERLVLEAYGPPLGYVPYSIEERFATLAAFSAWRADRCAADPACRAAYPETIDAPAEVAALFELFEAVPDLSIPLTPTVAIDDARMELLVQAGLATLTGITMLTELAYAINRSSPTDDRALVAWFTRLGRGNPDEGRALVASYLQGVTNAEPLWAVQTVRNCFDPSASEPECEPFLGSPYRALFDFDFRTDAPTLVLQGRLDFQSNPRAAELGRSRFSNVAQPELGVCQTHFPFFENASCVGSLVNGWLRDPSAPIDPTCARARCATLSPLLEDVAAR